MKNIKNFIKSTVGLINGPPRTGEVFNVNSSTGFIHKTSGNTIPRYLPMSGQLRHSPSLRLKLKHFKMKFDFPEKLNFHQSDKSFL
jgi:hypothetical protein